MVLLALVLIVILAISGLDTGETQSGTASPEPAGDFVGCPVTRPNGVLPPEDVMVFSRGSGDYGNEYLWTSLWTWGNTGTVIVPADLLQPDGTAQELKWPWYRFVDGDLSIEGHRLDADDPPLRASVLNESYGSGFIPSGLTFPRDGCRQVTGTVGDKGSLTFVVLVVWPGASSRQQRRPAESALAAGPDDRFDNMLV